MEKVIMSVQEMSERMGISLTTAYELVHRPGFPQMRVGKRILIPVDAFEVWLKTRSCQDT